MIIDLAAHEADVREDALIVVGSGAAGLALAEKLSTSGCPVVVVESGADNPGSATPVTADLNAGTVVGQPYRGLVDGRARALGGTTALWHGQCMRLHGIDLQERPWVPGSGWPISLSDLDVHYTAAERWLGVSGGNYTADRWQDFPRLKPIDWNPAHLDHDFTEYTRKPSLARDQRERLATDPQVTVLVNATTVRVLTAAGRVRGVTVATPDRRQRDIFASTVVLAAGAVENARLLQLSDPDGVGLGTGRRHTGRYLQDHPAVRTAQVIAKDYRTLQDRYVALHRGRESLFPKVRLSTVAQERHCLLDATAIFEHDLQLPSLAAARRLVLAARARRAPDHPWLDMRTALGAPLPVMRDTYRRYARGLATAQRPNAVWLNVWVEQAPNAHSRISLGRDVDGFGMRRAQIDWRVGDLEIETSRRLSRWVAEDLARLKLASVRFLPAMYDDIAWRESVVDTFHPSGTTRMSTNPTDGVVDPDLQVHGVNGLFVVGGSVFPSAGYANPTLTIVALALRLADLLGKLSARSPS